jgi:beta-alanine degradation protein BauB
MSETTLAAESLDPTKAMADSYRLLFENETVRVSEVRLAAGQKVPSHSNSASVIYVLNDGRLRHVYPDGKVRETDAKAGSVVWDDAETHATENIGGTEIHSIKVELKQSPR